MPENDWQDEISLTLQRDHKARAILGVSETADDGEIRTAFRRACTEHHPDANGGDAGAAHTFHLICCAYKCLTEGDTCPDLDALDTPPPPPTAEQYDRENPWGYWCWWRENFFGSDTTGD
jgi:hypothetical protein